MNTYSWPRRGNARICRCGRGESTTVLTAAGLAGGRAWCRGCPDHRGVRPGKSPVTAGIAYLPGQPGEPCALPGPDYPGWAGTGGSQISQRDYLGGI